MPEFATVATLKERALLDEDAVLAGYHAGVQGLPEPPAELSGRAFLFGWLLGAVDSGRREPEPADAMVVYQFMLGQGATVMALPYKLEQPRFPIQ